jgi:predicted AlkP superfamily pyrophosphatase or phosphodiesterase
VHPCRSRVVAWLAALFIAACATASTSAPSATAGVSPEAVNSTASLAPQKLVVLITVDQLRPDYLTRFESQLTGGLGRLYREGAVFTRAMQDHGVTETAPGHASTLSGRFPANTNIRTNATGVGDSTAPLIGSNALGASPWRFKGTTLVDWMIGANSETRFLSISRKDRGAILPIGRRKGPVFWYAPNGSFTTSSYYADSLPSWLTAFNKQNLARSYANREWSLLLPESNYPEPDKVAIEADGIAVTFPHKVPADSTAATRDLPYFPWIDLLTIQAALAGVNAMQLGNGASTDLLTVSLSATDAIGHRYGPDSRELHDHILRLDRMVGMFLDSLATLRGAENMLVALTADHGVAPNPNAPRHDSIPKARFVDPDPALKYAHNLLVHRGGAPSWFAFGDGLVIIDRAKVRAVGINPDSIVRAFRDSIRKLPGVRRADTPAELARMDTVKDPIARRWLHTIAGDQTVGLAVTLDPYNYWGTPVPGATHGSPYDYDAHVPLIFWGSVFNKGKYAGPTRVVDLGPTLAAALGIKPTEQTDGHPLIEALRRPK